ncbi:hypothetical protein KA977_03590 [Candidatus Dependentiae bacterium]|nr:hypothetical protein [Candidatus Dependentiae bacterium]
MNKLDKKGKIILLIIIAVLVSAWSFAILERNYQSKNIENFIKTELDIIYAKSNMTVSPVSKKENAVPVSKTYSDSYVRNPFTVIFANKTESVKRPLNNDTSGAVVSPDSFKLSGIILINNIKYAIINDNIVKEGDKLFGVSIYKISDNQVTIIQNDQLYYVNMQKPDKL